MMPSPDFFTHFFQDHASFFYTLSWIILGLGIFQNLIYVLQLPAAWAELRLHAQTEDRDTGWEILISDVAMPISLIIPAHNEEKTIVQNVRSMLSLQYPEFEVIVVNDGSKDHTLRSLTDAFHLIPTSRAYDRQVAHAPINDLYTSPIFPNLLVIDKENGKGKADACNAGLNFARNPLFCVVDADSILETESLLRTIRPYLENPVHMIAVGGTIRVANGCQVENGSIVKVGLPKEFVPLVQSMEYIRAFLMARLAWSRWGALSIISGAFGVFRRATAIEVEGFSRDTVGEDYDLITKMHRMMHEHNRAYAMRYVPEPVCWTEGPPTLAILGTQRKRWQRGAIEVFFKNIRMFLNPRYGKAGLISFPHSFLIDILGPIAEVIGYILIPIFWYMGVLSLDFFLAYIALFFVFGIFISVCSLILEEISLYRLTNAKDLTLLACVAVLENFGYRQLNNFWRVAGFWQYLTKKKSWGQMPRQATHLHTPS